MCLETYFANLLDNLEPNPAADPVAIMLGFEDACAEDDALQYGVFWDFVEWMQANREDVLGRIAFKLNGAA